MIILPIWIIICNQCSKNEDNNTAILILFILRYQTLKKKLHSKMFYYSYFYLLQNGENENH